MLLQSAWRSDWIHSKVACVPVFSSNKHLCGYITFEKAWILIRRKNADLGGGRLLRSYVVTSCTKCMAAIHIWWLMQLLLVRVEVHRSFTRWGQKKTVDSGVSRARCERRGCSRWPVAIYLETPIGKGVTEFWRTAAIASFGRRFTFDVSLNQWLGEAMESMTGCQCKNTTKLAITQYARRKCHFWFIANQRLHLSQENLGIWISISFAFDMIYPRELTWLKSRRCKLDFKILQRNYFEFCAP